jgi:hypothetical protein
MNLLIILFFLSLSTLILVIQFMARILRLRPAPKPILVKSRYVFRKPRR